MLVALAADGSPIRRVIGAAVSVGDDVVWFGAVGLPADVVVEEYAAFGAVCDASFAVSREYGFAEAEVACCAGS